VISTPVGSIEELVIDNVTGRLVSPKNSDALAKAIHELLTDTSKAEYLAKQGLDHVVRGYSLPIMVSHMQNVFQQVSLL
jgi:glycosyltransferase involved in cell wall biosynthesis